jgi:hypothetical protein
MIKRLFVLLVIITCMFALSLHFIVEGLGGVGDHGVAQQSSGMLHSHDGDQFLLSEFGDVNLTEPPPHVVVLSDPNQISRPLPPLLHPPKSF